MRTSYLAALLLTFFCRMGYALAAVALAAAVAGLIANAIRPAKVVTCSIEQVMNYECGKEVKHK